MRLWLEEIYNSTFFPAIASLKDTPDDHETAAEWAQWMKEQWRIHGLGTLKQQKNPMVEVRFALKEQLGKDHIIFDHMQFTTEEWTEINLQSVPQPSVYGLLITDPDAIVERATKLIRNRQWHHQLAGLTVLTGRRIAELLKTAEFTKILKFESPPLSRVG